MNAFVNSNTNSLINKYKKLSVHTASKEQILLMLYQTAIKDTKLAIKSIDEKKVAAKGEHIGHLQDIIIELMHALDFSIDSKLANELSSLYDFLLYSSTQANVKIDKRPLMDCLKILETLYSAWNQAIKDLKSSPANHQQKELKGEQV